METNHKEGPVTCGICLKKLGADDELDKHIYTNHRKVYKCGQCDYQSEQQDEVNKHDKQKHQGNKTCSKCEDLVTVERNYKLLKENYERLVTINKSIQVEAKDKGYAQDLLLAD